ncbi:hypothetical protein HAX54_031384, partial [Datura stramonium]|nr:hypothetical protein [Datura stramonium]
VGGSPRSPPIAVRYEYGAPLCALEGGTRHGTPWPTPAFLTKLIHQCVNSFHLRAFSAYAKP